MDRSTKFPEIICLDGKWFLRYVGGGEVLEQIELPNNAPLGNIWEATSKVLRCIVDDCGANLSLCVSTLREASKNFAGISEICAASAHDIEMDVLYANDEDEPWYNK